MKYRKIKKIIVYFCSITGSSSLFFLTSSCTHPPRIMAQHILATPPDVHSVHCLSNTSLIVPSIVQGTSFNNCSTRIANQSIRSALVIPTCLESGNDWYIHSNVSSAWPQNPVSIREGKGNIFIFFQLSHHLSHQWFYSLWPLPWNGWHLLLRNFLLVWLVFSLVQGLKSLQVLSLVSSETSLSCHR